MKLRYIIIAWVCYCGFLPILELHGAAAAAAAAGAPEPAAAGGGAPVRSFPPAIIPADYSDPFVAVLSLEFIDRGYKTDGWVNTWHAEKQERMATLYDDLSSTERFPMRDPDACVPNIACARLSLIYTEPSAAGTSSLVAKVVHYDACSSPAVGGAGGAAGGAGAPVTDLLFLSGLGWGRWKDSTAVQSYISEQGFEGITMDPYLPVDDPYGSKAQYLQHRMMCLQLKDFFAGSTWSRLPMLRLIQDDINAMDSRIDWVDRRRYDDAEAFNAAVKESSAAKGTLGQRFFDSEQVILRHLLDVIRNGSVVRELAARISSGSTLQRVVLNIASYKVPCHWCRQTYFWESEFKNLIATALVESLSIFRPDIGTSSNAKRIFVEFSGRRDDKSYDIVIPESLQVNSVWPHMAVQIIGEKPSLGSRKGVAKEKLRERRR